MNLETKTNLIKIKEIILTFLLSIWLLFPLLKEFKFMNFQSTDHEFSFILLIGILGIPLLIIDIFKNLKTYENKKDYCKKIAPIILLTIFMIWTLISAIFSENKTYAFLGTSYRKDGYITYLAYAGFFACAYLLKSNSSKKILMNLFIIIATLNIICVELWNLGIFTNIFIQRGINTTSFLHFNHYGYYLLLASITSAFLLITQKNKFLKVFYLFIYSFLLYYLILNNTFGCYLAAIITLILFLIYCIYNKKNKILPILTIVIFICMSFIPNGNRKITNNNFNSFANDINTIIKTFSSNELNNENEFQNKTENNEKTNSTAKNKNTQNKSNAKNIKKKKIKEIEEVGTLRFGLWKNAIKFFFKKPILGYGPENLKSEYLRIGIKVQDRPHNLLIQLATTSGIIGLVTYITAIGLILKRGLKILKTDNDIHTISYAVIIAYLISAMFGNSMFYTSPYFFIFLGFLMNSNMMNVSKNEDLEI